ncbi:MAG: ImmA/IrrE family metallo-endopeptidase, partial [Chlamydiota bacterium]
MRHKMDDLSDIRAIDIIRKYQTKPPVNILGIAHELRIKVYRTKDWPDLLSGQIIKDEQRGGGSGYAIFINALHKLVRQRFTIAHELAHFILHKPSIGDGITDDALYRSGLSNRDEAMANQLAAEILMPW